MYVQGRKEKVLQMAASNYLGMAADKEAKDVSVAAVDKYGVGSCGPRGFYGTIDVHLEVGQGRWGRGRRDGLGWGSEGACRWQGN